MGIAMDMVLVAVVGVVLLALLFDFTNGFHDAANSTSTVVATRAMKPRHAVYMAAFFNFAALFVVGTAVANTVAKTVQVEELGLQSGGVPVGLGVAFGALLGAIFWNYFTWSIGMPSSSSHALIGGLIGAGLSAGGTDVIKWSSVEKTALAIVLSPLVAFTVAFLAMFLVGLLQRLTHWKDDAKPFKWLQIISSAAVSFGHGANDAQKTMGVIAFALVAGGYLGEDASIPLWVELAAYSMIALGTMWGGWKIIETMGLRITKLNANSGVAANIGCRHRHLRCDRARRPDLHHPGRGLLGDGLRRRRRDGPQRPQDRRDGRSPGSSPCRRPASWASSRSSSRPSRTRGAGSPASRPSPILLVWAGRLMMHAENADDIEEMLPSEEELHQYHTVPHPDLHPYEGPAHVNHHEHEGHARHTAQRPKDSPLP